MCDFSLQAVASRPAVVGEKLVTHNFGLGTKGFAAQDNLVTAVCLLPGTEIAFDKPVELNFDDPARAKYDTAIFRQVNKEIERAHHDAMEFPDGQIVLLHALSIGQHATVLQLPAAPKTAQEAKDQERLAVVG